jgi:hypothetical protein
MCCLITASNGGRSSAPGITPSKVRGNLIPASTPRNYRLKTLLQWELALIVWTLHVLQRKHSFPATLIMKNAVLRLLVTTNVVPSSPILVTLMMEAIHSSETSALTRATRHDIPENDILHGRSRENLKSHIALTGWAL